MPDEKPTHLPAEGEGTPALPADSDFAPKDQPGAPNGGEGGNDEVEAHPS